MRAEGMLLCTALGVATAATLGPEVVVGPVRADRFADHAVGQTRDGYIEVMEEADAIVAKRFDRNGVALDVVPIEVFSFADTLERGGMAATGLSTGGFVVTWLDPTLGVGARVFDASGAPVTKAFSVHPVFQRNQAVLALEDGKFLVAWVGYFFAGRIFNPDGTPVADEFDLASRTAGAYRALSMTALPNGGFAAVFRAAVPEAGMYLRMFPDCHRCGSAPDEVLVVAGDIRETSISPLGSGLIVTGVDYNNHIDDGSMWARAYDANGAPRADAFKFASGKKTSQGLGLSDGNTVALVWSTAADPAVNFAVYTFDGSVVEAPTEVGATGYGSIQVGAVSLGQNKIALSWISGSTARTRTVSFGTGVYPPLAPTHAVCPDPCPPPPCGNGYSVKVDGSAVEALALFGATALVAAAPIDLVSIPAPLAAGHTYRQSSLLTGSVVTFECCGAVACDFYVSVYRCKGCAASDQNGALPTILVAADTPWTAGSCAPKFSAPPSTATHPMLTFHRRVAAGETVALPPLGKDATAVAFFASPATAFTGDWCPITRVVGPFPAAAACAETCYV